MVKSRFSKEYRQFIKSPEWEVIRSLVLKRDGHKCVKCGHKGSFKNALTVNHLVYPPHGSPMSAFIGQPIAQLETLCWRCHKLFTKRSRSKK